MKTASRNQDAPYRVDRCVDLCRSAHLAANLHEPSAWLLVPAWLVLALVGYLRFDEVPRIAHIRSAFYLMGIPLLFYAAAWRTAFFYAADVLAQPSHKYIYAMVSTRSFLVLVIFYLAAVCVFYSDRVRKRDDSIESLRRDRQKETS